MHAIPKIHVHGVALGRDQKHLETIEVEVAVLLLGMVLPSSLEIFGQDDISIVSHGLPRRCSTLFESEYIRRGQSETRGTWSPNEIIFTNSPGPRCKVSNWQLK